jgi:two-component system chemotaxis sensor kinase CheA
LVELEKNPRDRESLAGVFRTIHTIKGTCGFLGFDKLESVAHVGENLLSKLRDGRMELAPEITTALLGMVDAVRQMLASIEAIGNEGERHDEELIATLTRLQPAEAGEHHAAAGLGGGGSSAGADSVAVAATSPEFLAPLPPGEMPPDPDSGQRAERAEKTRAQPNPRPHATASDSTIRVDVGLLDKVMNLVGELVLSRNQVLQFTNRMKDTSFLAAAQRLNLITTELQEGVMKARMQPIGNIWNQFPRTVRDVALGCGKQVGIEMEGKETELDKTIIEAIKDPLTHLVRNAVDHGIELPEGRLKAGKDAAGRLTLRAFHEGGQVKIEISDDGAGLNAERIRAKAVERGMVTAEQAARMGEREVFGLIFLPGFSTAERVTNVSGRGVGMDVVKTNIEKIGGTVDVQSKAGQGTTVRMKIPLTLAIIPALIVSAAGDRFAIPQVSLLELVRLEGEQTGQGVELVNGAPVHRLRGRLLPLADLRRELQTGAPEQAAPSSRATNIVVLRADDRQFGLVVDEINDTEEIVVKPLSKQLKSINTYAGATIMGDGKVALILDVLGLAQRAHVVGEVRDRTVAETAGKTTLGAVAKDQHNTVLLFQYGSSGRMAIDLALVARLEEFPPHAIEIAAGGEVVQYRGQIMPLVRVSEVLDNRRQSTAEAGNSKLHVVVYAYKDRSVGLVVDRILDIVEESFVVQRQSGRRGVLGSAVIQKRVTDLLDVPGVIEAAEGAGALAAARG